MSIISIDEVYDFLEIEEDENAIARAIHNSTEEFVKKYCNRSFEAENFSVVRQLVGHGVGHDVHEEPQIPNYVIDNFHFILQPGMVLAFEPMINAGGWEVETKKDGWTVITKDGSCSAHFEHTVAVTTRGAIVITK